MVDYSPRQGEGVPKPMRSRYRDAGDGTHALVYGISPGTEEIGSVADAALAAARAGTGFCRKVNKKSGINGAATVLVDVGMIQTTTAGYRDVITCIYVNLTTASDSCEFEIGVTANADGTGAFTAMTPLFAIETGTAASAPSPGLTPFNPPMVITPAMGGAWTARAQTNDAGAEVTFGLNGFREVIP